MTLIHLIYASTGGNTELVSQKVAQVLESKKHTVRLTRAERTAVSDIKGADGLVLASSTYGHGLLQYHMEAFVKLLHAEGLPVKRCAVIGLGDDKYDSYYHMESAKILEKTVQDLGGTLIVDSLRISKSPVPHLDGRIAQWAEKLANAL